MADEIKLRNLGGTLYMRVPRWIVKLSGVSAGDLAKIKVNNYNDDNIELIITIPNKND